MNQRQPPILLFPTHYLGNFVLGLPWVLSVLRNHPDSVVVLDGQFEELARLVLDDEVRLLLYPRKQISKGQGFFTRLTSYWKFIRDLRRVRSDTLLDLEGERFTGVLAMLSGFTHRVGPTGKRAERFYTDIREPDYQNHRFNAFGEIVAGYTDGTLPDNHFTFAIDKVQNSVNRLLRQQDPNRALVAIHPGASVPYKLWPRKYFVTLTSLLFERGCQVVWIGAGDSDREIIQDIESQLENAGTINQADNLAGNLAGTINLCNRLSFVQLTALYFRCAFFVGSDSGPMHLAASTGIPVFALFGPSDESIWAPLGANSSLVRGDQSCARSCDAFHCEYEYRCMQSLQPEAVVAAVEDKLPDANAAGASGVRRTAPPLSNSLPNSLTSSLPNQITASVFIITLDEADNIGACLDRLVEFDEVIVVDSGSRDGTVEIANQYGNVRTSFREWTGFSAQKSHALSLCGNEWVLNVDADEILSDNYIEEVRRVVAENKVDALESIRILYRWGREPKGFHAPERLIRLFRKTAGEYQPRRVHEYISIDGEIEKTNAVIEHYENLTYTQRIDKANKYSQARAEDKFEKGARSSVLVLIFIFPVSFIQAWLFKGNFLDGIDGLLSSMNTAYYKFMKYAKLWELGKGRRKK